MRDKGQVALNDFRCPTGYNLDAVWSCQVVGTQSERRKRNMTPINVGGKRCRPGDDKAETTTQDG